jgi:muramoyltetrapeptide carboxypeptidase
MTTDAAHAPLRALRSRAGRARVVVVAPSSPPDDERIRRGSERLRSLGFEVDDSAASARGAHAFLNGDDDERARALNDALHSDAAIVWLARGGYGLTRILHRVRLPDGPLPLVVGFSDATALLAILARAHVASVHGPLATTLPDEPAESLAHLARLLRGPQTGLALDGLIHVAGPARATRGIAFAANLCVLTHLVGTPSFPPLDGAVLFVEEVGERPYRIDRMWTQLLASGALARVAAVVVGELKDCDEDRPRTDGRRAPTARDVCVERLASLDVPIWAGGRFGHGRENYAIANGIPVVVDAGRAWCDGDLP